MTTCLFEPYLDANKELAINTVMDDLSLYEGWTAVSLREHYDVGTTVNDGSRQLRFHLPLSKRDLEDCSFIQPHPSDCAMNFTMPAGSNITGKETTTLQLIRDGKRTGSTRHWRQTFEAGDTFEFADRQGNKVRVIVDSMTGTLGAMIQTHLKKLELKD